MSDDWKTYRTRFVVRARQLNEPFTFTDTNGHEHHGSPGDYVIESREGLRISRREIFEDVYIAMELPESMPRHTATAPRTSAECGVHKGEEHDAGTHVPSTYGPEECGRAGHASASHASASHASRWHESRAHESGGQGFSRAEIPGSKIGALARIQPPREQVTLPV